MLASIGISQGHRDCRHSSPRIAPSLTKRRVSNVSPHSFQRQPTYALLFLPLWPLPGSFFYLFPLLLPLVAPLGSIFGPKYAKISRSRLPQSAPELRISKEFLGLPRFSRCEQKVTTDLQNASTKCPKWTPKLPKVCQRGPKRSPKAPNVGHKGPQRPQKDPPKVTKES